MKETMKDIILNASVQMTESCHKTDFIVSRGERCLPDRSCIIRILKDLKRIMFPGYFGEENIALISPQYFIGDRLTDIYGKLKPQIEISLYYRDKLLLMCQNLLVRHFLICLVRICLMKSPKKKSQSLRSDFSSSYYK